MTAAVDLTASERARLWDRLRPGRAIDDRELTARVVWSVLAEPGDGTVGRLVDELGAADALELVLRRQLLATPTAVRREAQLVAQAVGGEYAARGLEPPRGIRAGFLRWQPRMSGELIESVFRMAAASSAVLLLPSDVEWPQAAADLGENAPLLLWCLGDVAPLAELDRSAALVGTRAATGYGSHVATEFAAGLAARGWAVVSGGAYGIDATAHRAALAARGRTIAVMAGGLHAFYPSGNSELIARVARTGLVVAEVPFGTPPTPFRFLSRNRLIAALTGVTVVIEAGLRSGSINTANHASELGRPLGVVPGPITSPSSAGCHALLRDRPSSVVTSVDEIIALAQGGVAPPDPLAPLADPDDPRYGRVRSALSRRAPRSVAEIAARSGLAAGETAALLGVLLLDGTVRKTDAGWVSVRDAG
ncbi:MAG TPA: DNA-processing protein DprA [Gryllotalpicola sp.]